MTVPDLPTTRVLIVDDNPEDREVFRRLFRRSAERRYEVLEAASGAQGLQMCGSELPECVLLDYKLPDMDGLEFLTRLAPLDRQHPIVPVVMITGVGNEDVAVRAMKSGAQDYLVKDGVTQASLQRAVQNAIERVSLNRRLEEQRRELQRSNRELQQFAFIISHDLKQPLATIKYNLHLLQRLAHERRTSEVDEVASAGMESVARMLELMNDVLEFSKVGGADAALEPVDLNSVLHEAVTNVSAVISQHGARVEADPLPMVLGHASGLTQLFQNLIDNAIKYRGSAAPLIRITTQSGPRAHQITIADNGIGIEPKDMECIFDAFQRPRRHSDFPGTGIGLCICKKVVERHGGRIWVESQPGAGSRFHFSLPADAAVSAAPPSANAPLADTTEAAHHAAPDPQSARR
ncbi:MAG TPA: ATP-binding protein [Phycisphaerae bacterium]|jgi:signal transduction histidine kinase